MNAKENYRLLCQYGGKILSSPRVQGQRRYIQHGSVSVYAHCINVAYLSVLLMRALHLKADYRAVVRGALLHDYFLYDWHEKDASHRWHGFTHAAKALENAERDFALSGLERDIIEKHMFPLNLALPRYKESAIVCAADKLCALCETVSIPLCDIDALLAELPPETDGIKKMDAIGASTNRRNQLAG